MFAEVVRANRQRLGLTQEELAASAGLGVRTIRKIEAGQVGVPRPATVRLLADAFGLAGADRKGFFQTAAGEPTEPRINGRVPAQVPADVSAFTGRAEQLAYLDALLAEASDQPTAVIISALAGTAGVGKTALAVHWAHRNRGRFPDGQLYVDLRGYDPDQPTDPAKALTRLLAALGVTGQDVPHELDDRAARYRSELADRRMLIVLDNAGSVEQVRPLLPGGGNSAVVVTSRDSLAGLVAVHGAHRLELDLLPPTEAMTLLRRLTGPRVDAEPAAAATLVEQCARLPLALRVAAELAASRPTVPLAELVTELGDQRRRLDLLDGGDPRAAVRTVFSWSIQHLTPDAAATFRLLGLHSGPDIDASAAAALAGTNLEDAHRWLELLCRAHLLQSTSPGRYGMHDLLRAYATELVRTASAEVDQRAARQRLFDHYLHVAHTAVQRIDPHSSRLPIGPPATGAFNQDLPDYPRATAWFAAERSVLVKVVERAFQTGYYEHAWQLAWCLGAFLYRNGHWHDDITVQNVGLEAAQRVADARAQAQAYSRLGTVYGASGRNLEARDYYQQALTRFRALGDRWGRPPRISTSASSPSGRATPGKGSATASTRTPCFRRPVASQGKPARLMRSAGNTRFSVTTTRPSSSARRHSRYILRSTTRSARRTPGTAWAMLTTSWAITSRRSRASGMPSPCSTAVTIARSGPRRSTDSAMSTPMLATFVRLARHGGGAGDLRGAGRSGGGRSPRQARPPARRTS